MSTSPTPSPPTLPSFLDRYPIACGVHNRTVALAFAWHELQSLYMSGPDRIRLLNDAAGGFFGIIQDILLDSLFLNLSVLSDPPRSGEHENLSFGLLAEKFKKRLQARQVWPDAEDRLKKFDKAVRQIRHHRNKRIAHGDVETFVKQATVLGGVTLGQLRDAVQLAFKTFNALCTPLSGTEYSFENPIITGDADSLVSALGAAKQHRALDLWLRQETVAGRDAADVVRTIRSKFFESPVPGVKPEPLG